MSSLNLLLLSTSVAPLGSGLGGGVELTLHNIALALTQRGHQIRIVAPSGSRAGDFPIVQIPGALQPIAQNAGRDAAIALRSPIADCSLLLLGNGNGCYERSHPPSPIAIYGRGATGARWNSGIADRQITGKSTATGMKCMDIAFALVGGALFQGLSVGPDAMAADGGE